MIEVYNQGEGIYSFSRYITKDLEIYYIINIRDEESRSIINDDIIKKYANIIYEIIKSPTIFPSIEINNTSWDMKVDTSNDLSSSEYENYSLHGCNLWLSYQDEVLKKFCNQNMYDFSSLIPIFNKYNITARLGIIGNTISLFDQDIYDSICKYNNNKNSLDTIKHQDAIAGLRSIIRITKEIDQKEKELEELKDRLRAALKEADKIANSTSNK